MPAGQRRIAQEVVDRPELLTGRAAAATLPGVLRFIDALVRDARATGQPMCDRCRERWPVCSRCGAGALLKGGTPDEPLCARCVNPDPAFWTRCGVCGITWQLTTAECARCSLDGKLSRIFTAADGTTAPQLDQLRQTFVQAAPTTRWTG